MATSASELAVSFRLLDDDAVRRLSVVEITNASTFDHGVPKRNGLQDAHMGSTDRAILCQTCHQPHCAGHFGRIELPCRVLLPGHVKRVVLLLRTVCTLCCAPLLSDAAAARAGGGKTQFERLKAISDAARKVAACGGCGAAVPAIAETNKLFLARTWSAAALEAMDHEERDALCNPRFSPDDAASVLRRVSPAWWVACGVPRDAAPDAALPRVLLVLPPAQRPTLRIADGGKGRGEDDMTMLYQDVVRAKLELEAKKDDWNAFAKLQLMVACLVKNAFRKTVDVKGAVDHGGARGKVRTMRDLEQRLKGKSGRLRGTLNAKRTDFSARTVVGIDMVRNIWQLGMPRTRMRVLSFPEKVTARNREALQERVRRGAHAEDGAINVIETGGVQGAEPKMIFLGLMGATERAVLAETLEIGWTVERHLRDGDWVLFNRQPTLHKMNMQAFQVYGTDGLTFRLPLPDTRPFNADYDGDEMNLHVPQTVQAIAEAQELMAVPHNMISPSNTAAIIAPVQETLVAIFRLTSRGTVVTREAACQLAAQLQFDAKAADFPDQPLELESTGPMRIPPPAILKSPRGPRWTGKQLFSMLLPPSTNCLRAVRDGDVKDVACWTSNAEEIVLIHGGELICGRICKAMLGGSGLVHALWKDVSPWAAAKFVSDVQRVGNLWNQVDAPCIGVRDCILSDAAEAEIDALVAAAMGKADAVDATQFPADAKEIRTSAVLQDVLRAAGGIVLKTLDPESALAQVVISGSKGNVLNLAQIAGVVGQQSIGGRRVPLRRTRRGPRGLICFPPGDRRPEALGFVATSYLQGQTEAEYFHAMMAGREGIVATAVETATSGYNQVSKCGFGFAEQCAATKSHTRCARTMRNLCRWSCTKRSSGWRNTHQWGLFTLCPRGCFARSAAAQDGKDSRRPSRGVRPHGARDRPRRGVAQLRRGRVRRVAPRARAHRRGAHERRRDCRVGRRGRARRVRRARRAARHLPPRGAWRAQPANHAAVPPRAHPRPSGAPRGRGDARIAVLSVARPSCRRALQTPW